MDRQIEGDFCTLPVMCKIINRMQFQRIYIVDPHSEKTLEFFRTISSDSVIEHEYIPVYPIVDWIKTIAQETDFNTDTDCLVFPDKGANEKYSKMNLLPGAHTASFNKIRNPHTGNIEKLALDIAYLSKCEKAIIVDDLCSRGGTFIGAASILKEVGVKDITLVVTHLEDTVFAGYLLDENSPVDRIYTSNSMVRKGSSEKIKILPININIH